MATVIKLTSEGRVGIWKRLDNKADKQGVTKVVSLWKIGEQH